LCVPETVRDEHQCFLVAGWLVAACASPPNKGLQRPPNGVAILGSVEFWRRTSVAFWCWPAPFGAAEAKPLGGLATLWKSRILI